MNNKMLLFSMAGLLLVACPSKNFAQTPTLGTTASYVLFTSNGAITNTGTSRITGNVGANIGASTGFGNVNGVMHSGDGSTGTCASDLLTLYGQLNTALPAVAHAPLLGNETLMAGIRAIPSNATLSQSLVLDAQGNPNAVFIFKISGTLSTTASASIVLANGALACNVFWKVEGAVDLASNTTMRGTIVANNGAIGTGAGTVLDGRALSTTGAISINGTKAKIPAGCGSAILTGPAAPVLGTAACFALFSGNGSATNAGLTYATGDVGTNVGLTVGYAPLLITGTIHPIPDVATATCASDLLNAYNSVNLLAKDIELLYPAQFGQGLVLTPHTYEMNGAASFVDTLYLDAEGNANAVFVIKINGALSTGTYATVVLVNGTQARNVFWKVDGAVTIDNFSNIKGTIICNNGAIMLNTGVLLEGRALTTNGALSTAAINVTMPAGCASLPVSWLYFRGRAVQEKITLEWATTQEVNNAYFTIEKSADGVAYTTMAQVNAVGQTQAGNRSYSISDLVPKASNYYRISQTDKDGHREYYQTIQVNKNIRTGLLVDNYMQGGQIYVTVGNAMPGKGTISLYTIDGKKLVTNNIVLAQETTGYKIDKPSTSGVYILTIESLGQKIYVGRISIP